MAAWRSYMPIYPPLQIGEDTVAVSTLVSTHRVALIDCPLLYVYVITGKNTSNVPHFEELLAVAECIFEGDQFDELNALLSDRLPVLDYAAVLNDEGAVKTDDWPMSWRPKPEVCFWLFKQNRVVCGCGSSTGVAP